MIKQLRGFLALCLVVICFAVAFSPGLTDLQHQAFVAIVDTSPKIEPIGATPAAGIPRYDKAAGLGKVISSSFSPARDGYMNWRMTNTTRHI